MTNLVKYFRREATRSGNPTSAWPSITLNQLPYWFGQFGYQGLGYGPAMIQTIQQNRETIAADFAGFINGAYKTNGALFAVMLCRMMLFSEARFQWQRMVQGRPGQYFGTPDLQLLEEPWPNGTTGDLLIRIITDVDLAGNFYATRVRRLDGRGPKIARLRPDWVTIIKGVTYKPDPNSPEAKAAGAWDPSAELVGYLYHPGGPGSGLKPNLYLPEEVCHVAPVIDPLASYRGMSWVQPIIAEVMGDRAMTTHKVMFFEQGATPNLVVSLDTGKMDKTTFQEWIELFEDEHAGAMNAYRTLYLGMGADATVVGANLRDLDYSAVQGMTELRIAAAGGIHPVILGLHDGLQASSLNNFANARRLTAEKTLRPLWRNTCGSLQTIVPPPGGARLWYDDRDIPFLKEDAKDLADTQVTTSTAIRLLVDAGYDPDTVINSIANNDLSLLKHTGLYSVQLQPPGTVVDPQAVDSQQGVLPGAPAKPQLPKPNGGNGSAGPKLASSDKRVNMLANVHDVQQLAQALLAARAAEE